MRLRLEVVLYGWRLRSVTRWATIKNEYVVRPDAAERNSLGRDLS
jgi:hypothetical protein